MVLNFDHVGEEDLNMYKDTGNNIDDSDNIKSNNNDDDNNTNINSNDVSNKCIYIYIYI